MSRPGSPARFLVVFSVLVWLTGSAANTAPMIPFDNDAAGVVCDPSTGHCYEYIQEAATWHAAKAAAELRTHNGVSGHLVTITSAAESAFIVANVSNAIQNNAWIGAYHSGNDSLLDGWEWVTGEPWAYTNWASVAPNDWSERAGLFWLGNGTWNDGHETHVWPGGYLVEYPAKTLGPDLVIGKAGEHGHTGAMAMLLGDGTGGFTINTVGFSAFSGFEVAAGDVNHDGEDDVVVVGSTGPVFVALGGFSDGLQAADLTSVGAFAEGPGNCCDRTRVLQLADINNDGNLDIAVTMWARMAVMLGNGDGTFGGEILSPATGYDARGMALGDLDGDGIVDLVANHAPGAWWLAFHKGNGNGTFQQGIVIPNSGSAIPSLFIRDADGDGDLDVLSGSFDGNFKVFANNGSASFTKMDVGAGTGTLLAAYDLNGDGADDVITGAGDVVTVTLTNGSGGYLAPATPGTISLNPRHGAVGDFNDDGKADVAIVAVEIYGGAPHDGELWILPGNGDGTFQAPYRVETYRNNYTIAAGNFGGAAAPTDTTPPVVTPTVIGTLVNGWYTSDVTVSWSVTDAESTPSWACATQTVTNDTTGTTFTCEATSLGGTTSSSVTVKRDTAGPSIASATASPSILWPPNNKMVAVAVSVDASDAGSGAASCSVDSVGSSEGGSAHEPDVELTGDLTMNLRAEREGKGSGRVYTAYITCTDAVGNSSSSTATVSVPHDQRKK